MKRKGEHDEVIVISDDEADERPPRQGWLRACRLIWE